MSRENGGKVAPEKLNRRPITMKMRLREILNANITSAVKRNKIVGFETQDVREKTLYLGFTQLKELGFHLHDPINFKQKHMRALGMYWEKNELAPATIVNRISTFRVFCKWIGKEGMIGEAKDYVLKESSVRRTSVATEDKSWSAHDIDMDQVLAKLLMEDYRVAAYVTIAVTFGLRLRECYMLIPHRADKGVYLAVAEGTKGNRDRVVPIESDIQREVIEIAKALAIKKTDHMGAPGKTKKQTLGHVNYILKKCGITEKDLGVTFHGLRHQYANDLYKLKSGVDSPVRGGPNISGEVDELARLQVSEALGHARKSITSAYLGGLMRSIKFKAAQQEES